MLGNRLLMHVYLHSGFPAAGTPRPSPPPSVCIWRKSVSESASGTWSRMVAWEQISCSCVYLVLTVHTGLFFHCLWAYQHTVSLLRGLYLPASGLKMWRHTVYKTLFKSELADEMGWQSCYDLFLFKFALSYCGITEINANSFRSTYIEGEICKNFSLKVPQANLEKDIWSLSLWDTLGLWLGTTFKALKL